MLLSRKVISRSIILVIVIILLYPLLFNKTERRPFTGTRLSEVTYSEITFENGEVDLAGMLMIPDGTGPFPAVVFIHGSGTSQRDSPWYLSVAKHFQENGIAVLLPDKRGSVKSGGDWKTASFIDLSEDKLGAIAYLKNQDQFQYSNIGIIGMSQGGWVAPVTESSIQDISFLITMSGAAVTTDEQLMFEEVNNLVEMGMYPLIAQIVAPLTTFFVKQRSFWKQIGGFDPIPYGKTVSVPAFATFGENDKNAPVEESVKRLQNIGNDNIKIRTYSDGGHAISDPISHKVQQELLDDLVIFVGSV